MKIPNFAKLGVIALASIFVLSLGAADVSAQGRSNKGGEMRGQDRADQVKQMNEEMKKEKGGMEKKAKKEKKTKKDKIEK